MGVDTEDFITATFALWAGDFEYAEALLHQYSMAPPLDGEVESPEDLIRRTGALRLRQLRQKKGEFKLLAAQYPSRELKANPDVLETTHLRGALWRLEAREFNLRAYLKDLSWQQNMLRLAHKEALLHERVEERVDQSNYGLGLRGEQQPQISLGASCTVTGSLLLRVQLSDLCLLEVNGVWTEHSLPISDHDIKQPFLKLLHALDPDIVAAQTQTSKATS